MLTGIFLTVSVAFIFMIFVVGVRLLTYGVVAAFACAGVLYVVMHWWWFLIVAAVITFVLVLGLADQHESRKLGGREEGA